MADDSFYQSGAGTQHPDFGPTPPATNPVPNVYNGLEALRPVVVRQLLEAQRGHSEANFVIDGVEVKNVNVVAEIVFIDTNHPTYNAFYLEDSTRGRIIARQWVSSMLDEDDKENHEFREHTYVRVIGELARFRERNSLNIKFIRAVVDFHEIYFHLLDVMVTTHTFERGPPPRSTAQVELLETKVQSVPGPDESTLRDIPQSSFPGFGVNVTVDQHVVDEDDSTEEADDAHGPPFWLSQPSRPASPSFGCACARPVRAFQIGGTNATGHPGALRILNSPVAPVTWNRSPLDASSSSAASPVMRPPLSPFKLRPSSPKRDPYSWMSALQRDIVLYISEAGPSQSLYPSFHSQQDVWDGVHVTDMARAMRIQRHVTLEDFSDALHFLEAEGYIYATVDDSHFKLTPDHKS